MEELNQLRKFYRLKNIERACSVLGRKESAAEHSWSCLILADYFLTLMNDHSIDRLKVYETLLYHDLVEIEAGDVNLIEENKRKNKKERERQALKRLKEQLPLTLRKKFEGLFNEFEAGETKEARFAKAIDALDAEIHELDYKKDWQGWTEEFLRKTKEPLFKEFPKLKEAFEKTLAYCRKEGYFNQ